MTTILVTGGNRGIGYAIVQVLGQRIPDATILVGCRDVASAAEPIQNLRELGIAAKFDALQIDITNDESIRNAVKAVGEKYGKLDVLINNAGAVVFSTSADLTAIRRNWTENLDCLVTSNAVITKAFMPLLRKAEWGRVVMVSSARGSLTRNKAVELPPSLNWTYNCSKAALNLLTIELRNAEFREVASEQDRLTFWTVSPGHCKTGFNNYRGSKDPAEGAEVIVRLLETRRGQVPSATFWEYEYGNFQQVPW